MRRGYIVTLTDHHPVYGGITVVNRPADTRYEATCWAEQEITLARALGMHVTYKLSLIRRD